MNFNNVHIVFENCEEIIVPCFDLRYIHLGDINESFWENNILLEKEIEFKTTKSVGNFRLIIKDKPEYKRILEHRDITQIHFMKGDDTIEWYFIRWHEDSPEFGDSLSQKTVRRNGEIETFTE